MITNFNSFNSSAYDDTETEIFSIITKHLKASTGKEVARNLADQIVAFCISKSSDDGFDLEGVLDLVWGVVIDVAKFVPHEDPRHDHLVQCLVLMRQQGDIGIAGEEVRRRNIIRFQADALQTHSWNDLPGLAMVMREKWRGKYKDLPQNVRIWLTETLGKTPQTLLHLQAPQTKQRRSLSANGVI